MADPFKPKSEAPVSIMIGRFSAWTVKSDCRAPEYLFKCVFTQGESIRSLSATDDGTLWTFTATKAFTAGLAHGRVNVDLVVVRTIDSEEVIISTFPIQCFSTDVDRRSHAQVMVDKIESILSGRADNDVESYTIKARSITKMSVRELTDWREYYLAELGRAPDPLTGRRTQNNTVFVGFR